MTRKLLSLALSVGALPLAASAEQTEPAPAPQVPAAQAEAQAVPAALAGLKFVHGKPDLSAKHYIFLQSASWCGPCQQHMPIIVAAYPEMKALGFEFILFSLDNDATGAMEMVESHKIPFAVAMADDAVACKLPGFQQALGIPFASWVAPDGAVRLESHPYYLFPKGQWRSVHSSYEAPRRSVKEALPEVTFLQGTPDPDARYYVYVETANTCAPCHSAMPRIVQAYEEMHAAGVEVIMCCRDNPETARKYAARYNVPFPVVAASNENAVKLPGFRNAGDFGIPRAYAVSAEGSPVWEGHPIRFFVDGEWKKHLK